MEDITGPLAIVAIFLGMPWIILHYVTQWKKAGSITREDENLLDDLHDTARRLEERLNTVERIITADNPNWKSGDIEGPSSTITRLEQRR